MADTPPPRHSMRDVSAPSPTYVACHAPPRDAIAADAVYATLLTIVFAVITPLPMFLRRYAAMLDDAMPIRCVLPPLLRLCVWMQLRCSIHIALSMRADAVDCRFSGCA